MILEMMQDPKNESLYTVDKAIEDINKAMDILDSVRDKYDKNELPKRN